MTCVIGATHRTPIFSSPMELRSATAKSVYQTDSNQRNVGGMETLYYPRHSPLNAISDLSTQFAGAPTNRSSSRLSVSYHFINILPGTGPFTLDEYLDCCSLLGIRTVSTGGLID